LRVDLPSCPASLQRRAPRLAAPRRPQELVQALQKRYGPSTIIHWEDLAPAQVGCSRGLGATPGRGACARVRAFSLPRRRCAPRGPRPRAPQLTALALFSPRARCQGFGMLKRLRAAGTPTFNDDIECTAGVTVAALLGALRLEGVPALTQQRFLFFGAGQVGAGRRGAGGRAGWGGGGAPEALRRPLIHSLGCLNTGAWTPPGPHPPTPPPPQRRRSASRACWSASCSSAACPSTKPDHRSG
jgi:hypothetical protein